ncbi:hypothetical protein BD626DRAFT_506962 [Schizophyllum amplum]|uniref:JmjC domain-containing protein n=1 Tax=Schizophyllum amplum TaxID=97359 RepID=A0A550C581_9AGAR|nr:hypothetical protein BD626DRAFT_506962 [Auriculariopsis ampla]
MNMDDILKRMTEGELWAGYDEVQCAIAEEMAAIAGDPKRLCQSAAGRLDDIAASAHKEMPRAGARLTGWRVIHTDACILAALADTDALASIARLDKAIIISGAAGYGRLDLILDLIDALQRRCKHSEPLPALDLPRTAHPRPSRPPTASSAVRELADPPLMSVFQRQLSDQPFVLRGYATDWPCCAEHPWASAAYLRSATGPGRLVPVEIGQDYRAEEWTQELMSWDTFLSHLDFVDQPRKAHSGSVLYMAQHDLLMQFPTLKSDLLIPDYVYACVGSDEYKPPANDDGLVLNAWLGPAGTMSPAHTDPFHNFYAQVVGRKTVWLAPPSASPSMYAYADSQHPASAQKSDPAPSMSNTSRVDVFADDESESRAQFPDFWDHVVGSALSVTLDAGDVLFFPPGWWHAMRSEDTSFSVSMWF